MAGFITMALLAWPPALHAQARTRAQEPNTARQRVDTEPVHRLIVKYRDDALAQIERRKVPTGSERADGLAARGLHTKGSRKALRLTYLKSLSGQTHVMRSETALSRADMLEIARTIASDPQVEYAEIDERIYPLSAWVPNDPEYAGRQWNLQSPITPDFQIGGANLPDAWGLTVGGQPVNGSGVTVAVLDTGYRPHLELVDNLLPGYDFVSADSPNSFVTANDNDGRDADAQDPGDWNTAASTNCPVADSTWHGTRVAGIIGADGNNGVGTIGAAYGAKILPVRVLGVCGGFVSDIAAGIQWAAGLGVPGVPNNTAHVAKVINLSIGASGSCSATFQGAITAARNAGSVIVVATGNDGLLSIRSPANCNGVIAVTAHDRSGDSSQYANIGSGTNISAPGGSGGLAINGIYSTSNSGTTIPIGDAYVAGFGTSFAAPHVSAVAALLFQIRPTISPDAVLHYLTANARVYPSGPSASLCYGRTDCGAGMLDAFGAANALLTDQGGNHAPVLAAIPVQTVSAGAALQFTVTASDADGDRVSFTATGLPSGASFDTNAGTFSWGYALPGNYSVTIEPYDGLTRGAPQTVQIRVTGALGAGGGGGGGALGTTDLAAAALLLLLSWRLRRRPALLHGGP
jgi:serine protease